MTKSLESSWGRVSRRKSSLCHSLTIDLRCQESRVDYEGCLKSSGENGEFEVYGERLPEPILGKNFRLPPRGRPHLKPLMDTSFSYIPVYIHLHIHPIVEIERPKMPELLLKAKHKKCMRDFIAK